MFVQKYFYTSHQVVSTITRSMVQGDNIEMMFLNTAENRL